MDAYTVVLLDEDAPLEHVFILYYAADDADHAREQAEDAEPNSRVIRVVPFVDPRP